MMNLGKKELFDLISAANYLDIDALLNCSCSLWLGLMGEGRNVVGFSELGFIAGSVYIFIRIFFRALSSDFNPNRAYYRGPS
jgi:hypothetical protein